MCDIIRYEFRYNYFYVLFNYMAKNELNTPKRYYFLPILPRFN